MKSLMLATLALVAFASVSVRADDMDKAKADMDKAATNTKVEAKKTGRDLKDKTCEMVNGKMECAAKKAGHKVENAVDDMKKK